MKAQSLVRKLLVLPAAPTMSAQVAAMHNYSSARSPPASSIAAPRRSAYSAPQSPVDRPHHHHITAKRRLASSTPTSPNPSSLANRKRRQHHQQPRGRQPAARSSADDCSDEGGELCKRAQHNVLERKRRNNLKWHFHLLRDAVPELAGNSRTPKVAILMRSAEHIRELDAQQRTLQAELDQLRGLQERWKWKLALLKRGM